MDNKKVYGVTFEVVEYDTLQFAKVEVTNKMEVIKVVDSMTYLITTDMTQLENV